MMECMLKLINDINDANKTSSRLLLNSIPRTLMITSAKKTAS